MRFKDYAIIATLLVGAGVCLWRGLTPSQPTRQPALATTAVSLSPPQVVEQAIETIQVGQRMWIGDNPSDERDYSVGDDIRDPSQWRKMVLRCPKRDGSTAEVEMLRPVAWLTERSVRVSGKVEINVPECSIEGMADVLGVQPCPPITQGQGRVVTATFHHLAAQAIDLAIEGLDKPIGTTPNHPFWSETEQDFVRADQLRPGDEVRTTYGTALVASITPRGPPEPVYNLEVQFEHVYRVGGSGVLVHNGGLPVLTCFTPSNQARRDFGTAVHQDYPEYLKNRYPGTQFKTNVGPGETGPDAVWTGQGPDPGFDFADLKPATPSGLKEFEHQAGTWGAGRARVDVYDPATGVISDGSTFK